MSWGRNQAITTAGSMLSIRIVLLFISSLPITFTCLPRYGSRLGLVVQTVAHFGYGIL